MGKVNQIKLGRVSNNLISGEHNLIHLAGKIIDKSVHEFWFNSKLRRDACKLPGLLLTSFGVIAMCISWWWSSCWTWVGADADADADADAGDECDGDADADADADAGDECDGDLHLG